MRVIKPPKNIMELELAKAICPFCGEQRKHDFGHIEPYKDWKGIRLVTYSRITDMCDNVTFANQYKCYTCDGEWEGDPYPAESDEALKAWL